MVDVAEQHLRPPGDDKHTSPGGQQDPPQHGPLPAFRQQKSHPQDVVVTPAGIHRCTTYFCPNWSLVSMHKGFHTQRDVLQLPGPAPAQDGKTRDGQPG
jgi:hypothetical protein